MKELKEKYGIIDHELSELLSMINNRLYELIEIAEENNYTDFGWKKEKPDIDDWDDFQESQFNYIMIYDFAYQTSEVIITRFKVEDDDIYGCESYNDQEGIIEKDRYIRFIWANNYNWRTVYRLVEMMEKELTEAGIAI